MHAVLLHDNWHACHCLILLQLTILPHQTAFTLPKLLPWYNIHSGNAPSCAPGQQLNNPLSLDQAAKCVVGLSEQPIACMVQQIYEGGLFHPSVTTSITGPLFTNNFSTSAVLQQNASIEAGYVCTCGEFYNNPCREEIRAVGSLTSCPAVCVCILHMCRDDGHSQQQSCSSNFYC